MHPNSPFGHLLFKYAGLCILVFSLVCQFFFPYLNLLAKTMSKEVYTRWKSGFLPIAGTIMLSCVSIISQNKKTPSLTAGGGERSTATGGGYLRSFSPLALSMPKIVFYAASFSTQKVLQRVVSLPRRTDIYQTAVVKKKDAKMKFKSDTIVNSCTTKITDAISWVNCYILSQDKSLKTS